MRQVGVGPHIGRVLAAEFEAERGEGAGGGRSIRRPPSTEPVKLMWSICPDPISFSVSAWLSTRFWNSPSGSPAAAMNASAKRSPTSSVCEACLRMIELPAISPGTIELIAVRYG
jgi:hypothetical protein